jgi:hypothetical protein
MTTVIGGDWIGPYSDAADGVPTTRTPAAAADMNVESPLPVAQRSLAELVSENPMAAAVLQGFGLDGCCRADRTVEEAARERGVPIDEVVGALP